MSWGYHTFKSWAEDLSAGERAALIALAFSSGDTNRALRGKPGYKLTKSSMKLIRNMDRAITKGRIDRRITLYRAVNRDDITTLWNQQIVGQLKSGIIRSDNAYIFTTLNLETAKWWRESEFSYREFAKHEYWDKEVTLEEFIVLEIEVPSGTAAAFLEVPGLFWGNRNSEEVILGRKTEMRVTGAELLEDGVRILKVTAQ